MGGIEKKVSDLKSALTQGSVEIDLVWGDPNNMNPYAREVILPIGKGYKLEGLGSNGEVYIRDEEGGYNLEGLWESREKKPNPDSSVGGYIRSVRIKLFRNFMDKVNSGSETK